MKEMKDFLLVYRELEGSAGTPEEEQENMHYWMEWFGKIGEAGKLADHGNPLEYSGRVVKPGHVVTNGPYMEMKEFIGGYSVIRAESYEEAVEIAKGCPVLEAGGSVEVREIMNV